ncbi:DUF1778 domain-containing protein [Proteus terrae]|uniref:type II toxin-antitoxin system TacA family antitoxin n=1 Tax=Proteus terrae TaxID=1574161 RepID=UPI001F20A92B|nr:DUF1778 domain-containing protein [Proteus terrae]MCE9841012.1 DUF1778 domain-containing protein [Proteus terrae]
MHAKKSQRALIDIATELLHKSRTDFILDTACQAAEDVILDRRTFNLNDAQYVGFIEIIDVPVDIDPVLEKLLMRKPLWEK